MFKKILAIILILCLVLPVFALDMKKAEPYGEDEFPKWSLNIRRGEVLFFGSMPITFAMTSLVTNQILKKTDMSFLTKLGIAAGLSASIVVIDFVLGLGSD